VPLSNPFTITIHANTALAVAAAALGSGQSADFSSGPAWAFNDSVTWQTATVYYDSVRKHVHAVGKVASNNPYEHYVYNEATDTWGANTLSYSSFGHMWATAFDPAEGGYYYADNGDADGISRYVSGVGWTSISVSPTSGYVAGMGWHPNLYGTGDGGLVVVANTLTLAWRRSTNVWSTIQSGQQDAGYNGGAGAWDSVNNKVWVGTGNSTRAAIVTAGSGGTVGTASTPSDPPLQVAGNGEGQGTNKVIPHPYTAGKLLLIASDTSAVYQSTNSGQTWSNAGYTHPFVVGSGQWTCGPIPGTASSYGVVWGLSSPGRGSMSKLWRPPA
jgi:hypothetical protein